MSPVEETAAVVAAPRALDAREFFLASLLSAYPDDGVVEALADLPNGDTHDGAGAMLRELAKPDGQATLQATYLDMFDKGAGRASLYETEYGRMRGMSKGNDLADLSGFYSAFGMALETESAHETWDHIAVELEFYNLLLLKQIHLDGIGDAVGCEIVEDARRKFLVDHLGRVALALSERPEVAASPLYGPVFAFVWRIVDEQCERLGVRPARLDWAPDEDRKNPMDCGAVHLPMLPT